MLESAISLTFGLLTVAWVLNLYRLVIGPSLLKVHRSTPR